VPSRHHIFPMSRRPGFESRQVVKVFFRKTRHRCCEKLAYIMCNVCAHYHENQRLPSNPKINRFSAHYLGPINILKSQYYYDELMYVFQPKNVARPKNLRRNGGGKKINISWLCKGPLDQGCKTVYFQTKIPNLGLLL
jgi:hypothetical protein